MASMLYPNESAETCTTTCLIPRYPLLSPSYLYLLASQNPKITFTSLSVFLAMYLLLCSLLRFHRLRYMEKKYGYTTRESLSKMTVKDAQEIQECVFDREFPTMAEMALQFALFRTYGIPTISSLLVETKQLSTVAQASKRFTDTGVLITEFVSHAPDSERTASAIARMNYIHSAYQKAGKISNDDMLYTLALFALEPVRWIDRYEWREISDMERCAIGVYWHSLGLAMGISYDNLSSHASGWRDGLHWWDEVKAWSLQYEEKYMVPDKYNKQTADETTAILLYDLPEGLKGPGRKAVSVMMDERLRRAMIYPDPPSSYEFVLNAILSIRKIFLRYFALPRPYALRYNVISTEPNKEGRYHKLYYDGEPWYVPNTFAFKFHPKAIIRRMIGQPAPGTDKYMPQGYKIEEVGPDSMRGKGLTVVAETKKRLMEEGRGGCPFAFGKR